MARYWVGGTGTWNGSDTSHWSATSGGASGASVPTASDDVFLDANSGSGTITTATPSNTATCRNFDCTGYTGTLTCTGQILINPTAGGTVTYGSGMTLTNGTSESIAISVASGSNCTMTANGKTLPLYNFTGSTSGGTTFADAVNCSNQLTHTSGTINTNNQNCTWGKYSSSNSNTRTLTLGTSTITISGTGTVWDYTTSTNLTFSATSSTINVTAAATTFATGGKAYGTVNFTGSGTLNLQNGGATFVNLTRTGTATKTDGINWNTGVGFTISGTLTLTGNSAVNRLLVNASTPGTAPTITAAAVSLTNVDFVDTTAAGASIPWTGTSLGNGLGNSNITFDSALTLYRVGAGGNWSASNWSLTSGGTTDQRVPLAQDTVYVDANASGSITADMPRMGADMDFTGFAGTLANSLAVSMYGSLTLGSGMTWSVLAETLAGRGTHTITSNGRTIPGGGTGLTIAAPGGTYTLADSPLWTCNFVVSDGTFDSDNYDMQINLLTSNTTRTRALLFGTSDVTFTRTSAGDLVTVTSTAITLDAAQSTFIVGNASANTRNFALGGQRWGTIVYTVEGASSAGGYGNITILGGTNVLKGLVVGPGRTVQATSGNTTIVGNPPAFNSTINGYYYFPGISGSYASAPDSAALSITGDIDIRADIALTSYAPGGSVVQNFVSKVNTEGALDGAYQFRMGTTGLLNLIWYTSTPASVTSSSTVSLPSVGITAGQRIQVRATLDVNNGSSQNETKFYYRTDNDISNNSGWTQLGATVTNSGVTNIQDSAIALELGTRAIGTLNPMTGNYYRAMILNGIAGTVAFDANFTTHQINTDNWTNAAKTTFVEDSANAATVTLNGLPLQSGDGRVGLSAITAGSTTTISKGTVDAYNNVFGYLGSSVTHNVDNVQLPGSAGNYIFAHDSSALSITGDIDLRAKVALDDWMPTSVEPGLVGKWSGSTQRSYALVISTTGRAKLYLTTDGATLVSASSSVVTGVTNGTVKWVRATWRQSDGRVQFFLSDDGVNWTQLGTDQAIAIASIFDSTSALELGATGGGTATLWSGKLYQAQVLDGIDGTVVAHFNAETEANRPTALPYNYLSIKDSTARGRGTWYAGMQSANVSGNTGWIFTGAVWPRRPQGTLRQAESLRQVETVRQVETTRQT